MLRAPEQERQTRRVLVNVEEVSASGRDAAAAPLNVQKLQLSYTIAFQQLWGDVHDLLSRSSVVNCDAVSNPNFHHPFPLPFPVCALLVCLVCGSCFLTLGLRSSCLHTGRSSLCLTIDNTQPQQLQQANQHSLLLTHNPQGIHLHPLTLSTHRSRYSHSYSLVVSIRCQWSCSQASSTDRTTYIATQEIQQAC